MTLTWTAPLIQIYSDHVPSRFSLRSGHRAVPLIHLRTSAREASRRDQLRPPSPPCTRHPHGHRRRLPWPADCSGRVLDAQSPLQAGPRNLLQVLLRSQPGVLTPPNSSARRRRGRVRGARPRDAIRRQPVRGRPATGARRGLGRAAVQYVPSPPTHVRSLSSSISRADVPSLASFSRRHPRPHFPRGARYG